MKHLNLSGSMHVTDIGLHAILQRCPELEVLNVRGCKKLMAAAVDSFRQLIEC